MRIFFLLLVLCVGNLSIKAKSYPDVTYFKDKKLLKIEESVKDYSFILIKHIFDIYRDFQNNKYPFFYDTLEKKIILKELHYTLNKDCPTSLIKKTILDLIKQYPDYFCLPYINMFAKSLTKSDAYNDLEFLNTTISNMSEDQLLECYFITKKLCRDLILNFEISYLKFKALSLYKNQYSKEFFKAFENNTW